MNKPSAYELDELDLMLVRELELDARQTSVTLARKLKTSQTTVKRRLQRLLDDEIITFATLSFIPLHQFPAIIALKVKSGTAGRVAEYFRSHVSIQRIILTTGRYDMILSALFRDHGEMIDFFDNYLILNNVPELLLAEKMVILETTKSSWKYLNDNINSYHRTADREYDELDYSIVKELELSPRKSLKELGDSLGANPRAVSKRIQSLLTDGAIRVVSIINPSYFDLNISVFILAKIESGRLRAIANGLVSERRIHHIQITTGPFELFITATFRDMEELSDFLMNRLKNYDGIISHETLIWFGFAKRTYAVPKDAYFFPVTRLAKQ